jgi:hypothetical protein
MLRQGESREMEEKNTKMYVFITGDLMSMDLAQKLDIISTKLI